MVSISKLYCNGSESGDSLRYRGPARGEAGDSAWERRPIVVWNVGKACNLRCRHCYSGSTGRPADDEMSSSEKHRLLEQLAEFGVPAVLFSGGEPLYQNDHLALLAYARELGLRVSLSTNGTLITPALASRMAELGVSYVGVSIDGLAGGHDSFRRVRGAFAQALYGIRTAQAAGLRTGLRFTVSKRNVADVPGVLDLIEREEIDRICFYHLVYVGRGSSLIDEALEHGESRALLDLLMDRTADFHRRGLSKQVLTVSNHADGPYLYRRLLQEDRDMAAAAYSLLERNGGNSTGVGIAAVGWDGTVYPDQFWRTRPLGNVTERRFGEIWTDRENPFLAALKEKASHVTGRCARCRYLRLCGGNFRARAEAVHGDSWAPDPACYLTDEEIAVS